MLFRSHEQDEHAVNRGYHQDLVMLDLLIGRRHHADVAGRETEPDARVLLHAGLVMLDRRNQARNRLGLVIAREDPQGHRTRSEEHTSELQSLMRISYAVFCLKKKTANHDTNTKYHQHITNHA